MHVARMVSNDFNYNFYKEKRLINLNKITHTCIYTVHHADVIKTGRGRGGGCNMLITKF